MVATVIYVVAESIGHARDKFRSIEAVVAETKNIRGYEIHSLLHRGFRPGNDCFGAGAFRNFGWCPAAIIGRSSRPLAIHLLGFTRGSSHCGRGGTGIKRAPAH